jgi:hypothetical protein
MGIVTPAGMAARPRSARQVADILSLSPVTTSVDPCADPALLGA